MEAIFTTLMLAVIMGFLLLGNSIGTDTGRQESALELAVAQDSIYVLQAQLNDRADPLYFSELKQFGFDCRMFVNPEENTP